MTAKEDWSIHEALAVAYEAFTVRFGEDVLWRAFDALTRNRAATMQDHESAKRDIDKYLQYPLSMKGSTLDLWVASARADPDQAWLLLHAGVRWWNARDDLLSRPSQSRVPCEYANGSTDHVSLQLLSQMLYRGRAPYTTCD